MKSILIGVLLLLEAQWSASTDSEAITVDYTYWSSMGKSENIKVRVPANSNFYHVMETAAEENKSFEFNANVHPLYGHYITSIGGISEDKPKNIYWMIYILPSEPNQADPPDESLLAPKGVDSIIATDDVYYLFWLKYVDLCNTSQT